MTLYIPRSVPYSADKTSGLVTLDYSNDINKNVVAAFDGARDVHDGTEATLYNGAQYVDNELIIGDESDDWADLGKAHTPVGFTLPFTFLIDFTPTKVGVWNRLYKSSGNGANIGINAQINNSNKFIIAYGDGTAGSSTSRRTFVLDNTVSLNQRLVIAVTITGPTIASVFVNGEDSSYTTSGSGGSLVGHDSNATVGRMNIGGTQYYDGKSRIRFIGLYSGAVSDELLRDLSLSPYETFEPYRAAMPIPSAVGSAPIMASALRGA